MRYALSLIAVLGAVTFGLGFLLISVALVAQYIAKLQGRGPTDAPPA